MTEVTSIGGGGGVGIVADGSDLGCWVFLLLLVMVVAAAGILVVVVVLVGKRRGKYCNSREKHKNPIIAALSLFDAFMNHRSSNAKYLPP